MFPGQEPIDSADGLRLMQWRLIKLTGWTLDYVDSLSMGQLRELYQLEDGDMKAAMRPRKARKQ